MSLKYIKIFVHIHFFFRKLGILCIASNLPYLGMLCVESKCVVLIYFMVGFKMISWEISRVYLKCVTVYQFFYNFRGHTKETGEILQY